MEGDENLESSDTGKFFDNEKRPVRGDISAPVCNGKKVGDFYTQNDQFEKLTVVVI